MNKNLYTFGQKGCQRAANLSVSFLRSRLATSPRPLPAPEPEAPPRPREGPRSRRNPSVLFSSVRRAQCSAEDNSTKKVVASIRAEGFYKSFEQFTAFKLNNTKRSFLGRQPTGHFLLLYSSSHDNCKAPKLPDINPL